MILRRATRRLAFWLYALLLFTGTHYPALKIPMPGRPDLFVHTAIFGTWTILLIYAGYFGSPLSLRNIGFVAAIAPVYAAIDEGLQAIPFIKRHAAMDDWAANLGGIAIACIAALVLRFWLGSKLPAVSADRTRTSEASRQG